MDPTSEEKVKYIRVGETAGYGSYHFASSTVDEIETLIAQEARGRRVNSIFGEGVNPRLRKIRAGLELVGLLSDAILNHGNKRIVYAIPLAENFSDVLLGKAKRPKYIFAKDDDLEASRDIARFWTKRWLAKRIDDYRHLDEVAKHTLIRDITHGARVTSSKSH